MQYMKLVYPERTERFLTQKKQQKDNLKEKCQKFWKGIDKTLCQNGREILLSRKNRN